MIDLFTIKTNISSYSAGQRETDFAIDVKNVDPKNKNRLKQDFLFKK